MRLMTHVVVGYPTLAMSERIVDVLAEKSDFIELQIPFSDPVADGPTIAAANDVARQNDVTAKDVLAFAARVARRHPTVRFVVMSYVNSILAAGGAAFIAAAARAGVYGFIIPDLPVEEAGELMAEIRRRDTHLIFVLAPNTADARLKKILARASGVVYCVARLGVTGKATDFSVELASFLARVRKYTTLPIAVGFGVATKKDVAAIRAAGGDIAVVGSAIIRAYEKENLVGVEKLVAQLTK